MKSMTSNEVASVLVAARTAPSPRRLGKTIAECFAFRDMLFEHVSARTPRLPSDLRSRVELEWGAVAERYFYRALAWLVSRGKVARIGAPGDAYDGGYIRTEHGGAETAGDRLARDRIQLADERRCYRCRGKITVLRQRSSKYCQPCDRAMHRAVERRSDAKRRAARATAVANADRHTKESS